MWSTGILILFCILSFLCGEFVGFLITALLSANREDNDNDDKQ